MAHIIRDKKKLMDRFRRLRGQLDAAEAAIAAGEDCTRVLHTLAACRGALNGLMTEVLDGHIRFHVVNPDERPTSARAKAAQELIDIVNRYLK